MIFDIFSYSIWAQYAAVQHQVVPKLAKVGSKLAEVAPKLAYFGPKLDQSDASRVQVDPKWVQKGA